MCQILLQGSTQTGTGADSHCTNYFNPLVVSCVSSCTSSHILHISVKCPSPERACQSTSALNLVFQWLSYCRDLQQTALQAVSESWVGPMAGGWGTVDIITKHCQCWRWRARRRSFPPFLSLMFDSEVCAKLITFINSTHEAVIIYNSRGHRHLENNWGSRFLSYVAAPFHHHLQDAWCSAV